MNLSSDRVTIALASLGESARQGLLAFCVGVGLSVVHEIFEEELTQLVGPRGKHDPQPAGYRHGREDRQLTLGGGRVEVKKPRGRTKAGGEVELESYRFFASRDLLTQAALDRMLAGDTPLQGRPGAGAASRRDGDHALLDLAPVRDGHQPQAARADGA